MGMLFPEQAHRWEYNTIDRIGELLLLWFEYWSSSLRKAKLQMIMFCILTQSAIANEIISDGKRLSNRSSCPLMYEWHGKKYWGAAHGLTGIMHVLMDMDLNPEDRKCIKATLNYMIQHRFESGNYPSSQGSESDRLVHWCHGAPGVAVTLTKAAQVTIVYVPFSKLAIVLLNWYTA